MSKRILLVDDDIELSMMLAEYLTNEGYQVSRADSAEAALEKLRVERFDLWVLDIMMPGMSGLELLQQIRPQLQTPVIMLTGRGDDIDRILGLEMGADDYLSKPANPRELLARIKAVLRRVSSPGPQDESRPSEQPIRLGPLYLDTQLLLAQAGEVSLELTSAEFNVLAYLMRTAGQLVSKEHLTEQVLHRKLTPYDRAIDVHVSRLRSKLEQAQPGLSEVIKTIRGQGYQLALKETS